MGLRRLVGALAPAVAVIAAGIAGGDEARAQADEQRPNIVVVMTDDQTQASVTKMPTVSSQLAGHGTTSSTRSPARSSASAEAVLKVEPGG